MRNVFAFHAFNLAFSQICQHQHDEAMFTVTSASLSLLPPLNANEERTAHICYYQRVGIYMNCSYT